MPPRPPSLVLRLALALAAVSVLLAGIAAVALDTLYRRLTLDARNEVLDAQVIALIATAEPDQTGRLSPSTLAEARLSTPGSGLYAEIRDAQGETLWRSPSAAGSGLGLEARPAAGERAYERVTLADGTRLLALSLGVRWEAGGEIPRTYVISAAESLEPYFSQLARVRGWLGAGAVVLMSALIAGLTVVLRSGLRPLVRLERQILDVEAGRLESLDGPWPRELTGVTGNLNALLEGERQRLARYRSTLGNLAHSLKTPIAALRSLAATDALEPGSVLPELERMQSIVDHQLRRAVLGGSGSAVAAIPVEPPLRDLVSALTKVHRDRDLSVELEVEPGLAYPIETGDLLELGGNLLDNAFKYAQGRVRVLAGSDERRAWRRPGIRLAFEDDGPGIPPADRHRVLERGVRADESVAGQGIGLAAAREVAVAYGGSVAIGSSPLGGAAVRVELPGR
jgi:two-component system sensor histidine kinase PhoQ